MKNNTLQRGFTDRDIKDDSPLFGRESVTTVDKADLLPPELAELEKAVDYIAKLGDGWNGYDAKKAGDLSVDAARRFLSLVPLNRLYPTKVSPDGEGGIIFTWKYSKERILLTIDGSIMHLFHEKEGKADEYIDDVLFDFSAIPDDILSRMPLRKSRS